MAVRLRRYEQRELWPERTGLCEHCDAFGELVWSATGSVAEDANPGMWLCRPCDEEHQAYWTEVWDDYHSGLL